MTRRLPVYLLIDTSGSMKGEPIEAVKVGIEALLNTLRRDAYALETVCISIITYDKEARQIVPLTPIDELQMPEITVPDSGPTHTGAALEMLCQKMDQEIRITTPEVKGDWMPILFIMTDGKPSDIMVYNNAVQQVKRRRFASIVACAAGPKAKTEHLQMLTDDVYRLDNLDGPTFMRFFQWLSDVINQEGRSVGSTERQTLPAPPAEIKIDIK